MVLWTCLIKSMSLLCWGPRGGHSTAGGVSQSGAEEQNCLSHPTSTLLGMQPRTQLAFCAVSSHCWLMSNLSSISTSLQVLLRAALNPFSASLCLCLGLSRCRTLRLALLNFIRFIQAQLKPVLVPLDGIPSLRCADHTSQLGVVGKLAEGALNPTGTNKGLWDIS